ncbi:MAG: chromophore lyase CpcT/CpeT [Planctomycetota bacterium]
MLRPVLASLALLALPAGCTTSPVAAPPSAPAPDAAAEVAALLEGSYTSAAQAAADPEFLEVELHMRRIWPDRTDGHWLYVEQAMAAARDKPYRQRIYCVANGDSGSVLSMVFELPDPASRIGAWRTPEAFAADAPERLTARDGCVIRLSRDGDGWSGSTNGRDCLSSLRGATYATSEVRLMHDRIETWDRGFDAADAQVWGSRKGAYRFVKAPAAGEAKTSTSTSSSTSS